MNKLDAMYKNVGDAQRRAAYPHQTEREEDASASALFNLFPQLATDLSLLTGTPHNWRQTKIGNWNGGFVAEHARMSRDWWRDPEANPRDARGRQVIAIRDDHQAERRAILGSPHGPVTFAEVAEHQRDREKVGHDNEEEYLPSEGESVQAYCGRLAKSLPSQTILAVLLAYASRFKGGMPAKENLDAGVLRAILAYGRNQ